MAICTSPLPALRAAVAERTAAPAIPLEPADINIRPQSPLCISLLRFPIIVLTRSSVIILVVMMIFLPFPSDFRRILLMSFWTAVLLRCRLICRRSRPACRVFLPAKLLRLQCRLTDHWSYRENIKGPLFMQKVRKEFLFLTFSITIFEYLQRDHRPRNNDAIRK